MNGKENVLDRSTTRIVGGPEGNHVVAAVEGTRSHRDDPVIGRTGRRRWPASRNGRVRIRRGLEIDLAGGIRKGRSSIVDHRVGAAAGGAKKKNGEREKAHQSPSDEGRDGRDGGAAGSRGAPSRD